ncbi:MAG: imidazole glycerol phosphate synthase subunit HisH, partial [Armatimonadetes bacterium]|nr:imidazole glycerol phosphate synthase subunit HisH [Armatimonadota bacterium]
VRKADKVVLPGVGAFCAAMTNLDRSCLREAVVEHIQSGKPFLGICLGLQMLFEESSEMGSSAGLGLLPGRVVKFFEKTPPANGEALKVPHIGWNTLQFPRPTRLFVGLEQGASVYFVHSYYPEPTDPQMISATSDYGLDFCCAVEHENIVATQFHPEKSGAIGLQMLRNFVLW